MPILVVITSWIKTVFILKLQANFLCKTHACKLDVHKSARRSGPNEMEGANTRTETVKRTFKCNQWVSCYVTPLTVFVALVPIINILHSVRNSCCMGTLLFCFLSKPSYSVEKDARFFAHCAGPVVRERFLFAHERAPRLHLFISKSFYFLELRKLQNWWLAIHTNFFCIHTS